MRITQINLNHHWAAQNLLVQYVAEHQIDVACITEPASVPRNSRWFSSTDGLSAIFIGTRNLRGRCLPEKIGRNFIVARCDWFFLFSVYISPNEDDANVNLILDDLSEAVRNLGGRCIVSEDFNAKSTLWGSPVTDWRGSVVERWAAELDLNIANIGSTPTCVRHNDSSIVDLTWASADVFRFLSGQVLSDAVSLSDHRYIAFKIGDSRRGHAASNMRFPRWNIKTLDKDLFRETLDWLGIGKFPTDTVEDFASGITRAVSAACDISAKRLRFRNPKRGVYWWSDDLAQARRRCVAARRMLCRARRRGRPYMDLEDLYKKARSNLAKKIRKAKTESWDALISTLDEDPWGIPYRIVMDRLRDSGPSMFESLEPVVIEQLLDELFPSGDVHDPDDIWRNGVFLDPDYEVTCEEVKAAIRGRRKGGCPAPGPDGLSLTLWRCVPRCVKALAALFTLCLEKGQIPASWKRAILVLIPKAKGQLDTGRPKARPICLLNDIGKFFERILDRRLKLFKAGIRSTRRPARVLKSGMQFGFTEGVSTVDALSAVTDYIKGKLDKKLIVIAVGLDIKNAFNSVS